MGGEEAVVDCGDDGEEGNYFYFRVFLPLGFWEEGSREALPDCGDVEREHEFDC